VKIYAASSAPRLRRDASVRKGPLMRLSALLITRNRCRGCASSSRLPSARAGARKAR
jgi:hypothetical protein